MVVDELQELLEAGVGSAYPSATAVVVQDGITVFSGAAGLLGAGRAAELDTVYDLASLTKPMATGSVLWAALADGRLTLDQRVGPTLFPEREDWSAITVEHLAGHASGLPAWKDLEGDWEAVAAFGFEARPGRRAVYSDLGYIALGRFLERWLGENLDRLMDQVAPRFALTGATFAPAAAAPTEVHPVRGPICGAVHDPNAYALGGVCGHAGLFSTASVVAAWGAAVLGWLQRPGTALGGALAECWSRSASAEATSWRIGLDSVTPGKSSAGRHFSARARGHLGYTGTSVWIDPEQSIVVALLTNRVHPVDHANPEIKRFRPRFHDAVAEAFFRQV